MRRHAWLLTATLLLVAFAGCSKQDGPTKEELGHMISGSRGAIAGVVKDRNNESLDYLNVKLFMTNTGEKFGEVETDAKGRFYFRQLFPTQYRVSVNLKDWTDCIVQVQANKFTNLTITQPVYPAKPRSC